MKSLYFIIYDIPVCVSVQVFVIVSMFGLQETGINFANAFVRKYHRRELNTSHYKH